MIFFVTIFFTMKLCRLFRDNKMFTIFDCQFSISHEAKRCSIFDFLVSFFLWFLWISRWDIISTWKSQVTCKLFGCISFFPKCKQFSKGFNQSLSAHSVETPAANDCCKVVFFLYFSHLLHAYHIDPTKNLIEQHGSNYFKLNTYMYAQFGVDVC